MEEALRKYEAAGPEQCALIPSEDPFYGVSKGQGRLQRHMQWVYIPAVKDASSEQAEGKSTALGKLPARTVRAKVNFSEGLGQLTRVESTSGQLEAVGVLISIKSSSESRCALLQNHLIPIVRPRRSRLRSCNIFWNCKFT